MLEKIEKFSALVGVPISIAAVFVAYLQLESAKIDARDSRTIQVVMDYLTSDVISKAKETINANTKEGSDYSQTPTNTKLQSSVRLILNYLETVSTGINNGVYDEKIACAHLRKVVEKQVTVHIKGQIVDGVTTANTKPFNENDYKSLVGVYNKWRDNSVCGL